MTYKKSKTLNVLLWTAQLILAVMFIMIGIMKTFSPIENLVASGMKWAEDSPSLARFIGISELLGAIGLILPSLLKWKTTLTVLAAIGIATIMVLAVIFHIYMGEASTIAMPLFLGILAAFVAWGRNKK